MPSVPVQKVTPLGWLVMAAFFGGLMGWVYKEPSGLLILGAFAAIIWIGTALNSRRVRRLAESRGSESICDFARFFDRRTTDTWIIRAVYEELANYLEIDGRSTPVRPSDKWDKDLNIDSEDLAELVACMAFRAQRSLDGAEQNPLWGKVYTVADIVVFLESQPKIATS